MREDERTIGEVTDKDFIANAFTTSEVVADVNSKAVSPELNKLDDCKQSGETCTPPSY